MKIALTGATGFIGRALISLLETEGHSLVTLTREPRGRPGHFAWSPIAEVAPAAALEGAEAVIHLAGEPVAQRWTAEAKQRIRDSRVLGTRNLVQGVRALDLRPKTLICASAIGYYGDRGDEALAESSDPGNGFLADTCVEWEDEAQAAQSLGIRVVRLRIGVVLGIGGGALEKMLPPFRLGVGGRLGDGRQWMSWIHLTDLARMIDWALKVTDVTGALNGTSPNPVTNAVFTQRLAEALGRRAIFSVPSLAMRLMYGEMAEVVLGSQRVLPRVALNAGFRFEFPGLDSALASLLR